MRAWWRWSRGPCAALGELADELDQPPPIRRNGTLSVASSDEAVRALDALLGAAASAGLCVERPDPRDLPKLVPWLNPACVRSCAFMADDAFGWEALEAGAPALREYCPAIADVGIRGYVAGVSTYTPDGLFLAGPVPGIAGLSVASGCCGACVAASGGLGQILAAMALGEEPSVDPVPFALDRFGPVDPRSPEFRLRCVATRSGKAGG